MRRSSFFDLSWFPNSLLGSTSLRRHHRPLTVVDICSRRWMIREFFAFLQSRWEAFSAVCPPSSLLIRFFTVPSLRTDPSLLFASSDPRQNIRPPRANAAFPRDHRVLPQRGPSPLESPLDRLTGSRSRSNKLPRASETPRRFSRGNGCETRIIEKHTFFFPTLTSLFLSSLIPSRAQWL